MAYIRSKMFKWRYLWFLRLDSHYFLKLLIIFNLFLGIYLIFLSTNYRKSNEYAYTSNLKQDVPAFSEKLKGPVHLHNHVISKESEKGFKTNAQMVNKNSETSDKSDKSKSPGSGGNGAINTANEQPNVVDKVYDSNNRLVVQEESGNGADASYKKVEEDDKSLDETDKLRIEMFGKPGEHNSIILESDDGGSEKQAKSPVKSDDSALEAKLDPLSDKTSQSVSKDVINRIIDHNQHIKKNYTKLIVPEAINVESLWWTSEVRGKYTVLRNYVPCNTPVETDTRSITLTTQGTPDFFMHAEHLCRRWDGFISLAVYAPGDDFRLALNQIFYMRQCSHRCVAERISWHLIYDTEHAPMGNITAPAAYLEIQNFDCNIPMDETMNMLNIKSDYRKAKSLPYPINVLRNVARLTSKTKYLFASDIELYPSVGIVPAFFDLLEREKNGLVPLINPQNRHVYVIPIFEVKEDKQPPKTKLELSKLFLSKDAIFFHRYVCDLCQNFPDRNIWIKEIPPNNTLNVFRVTRRLRERNQWEPLYIGTNDEPFYDERLTWDGKRDKMSQMYEMCLMNYDLLVLDNAFLVHAPGIKKYNVKDDKKRLPFIIANQKVYNSVLANLRRKFGTKNKC